MRFCRLCGAEPLAPLVVDAAGNRWHRCSGCGCDQSDGPRVRTPGFPADRLEWTPTPLRFLVELHAQCPMGGVVVFDTPLPGKSADDEPYTPANLQVLSPGFLQKTVTELGFKVLSCAVRDGRQHWKLQKIDGL